MLTNTPLPLTDCCGEICAFGRRLVADAGPTCAVFQFHAHYMSDGILSTSMTRDAELLHEYARTGAEGAFRELVDRHVSMVYSAALRQAHGNVHLAEELSQLVFAELARKAAQLTSHPTMAGWLYTSVRLTAANARRSEHRRQRRQVEYHAMSHLDYSESPENTWAEVRPVLDDALHELGEADRAALVLRFFEGLNLRQVGEQLGLTENAARMRVERALDKLQELLSKRGIRSTSAALAVALLAGAIISTPAGLAASIVTTAVTSHAASSATAASVKFLKLTMSTKKLVVVAAVVALIGTAASIHLFYSHPEVVHQFHQWLRHP